MSEEYIIANDRIHAAGVLCGLLYGGEDVSKLIGGSDALILRDAANEIRTLRDRIRRLQFMVDNGLGEEDMQGEITAGQAQRER